MDKKTALLYAQLKPYKALVNKTSGFIRWALERVENPYVACSFGKDSAVMLHLILQHIPDINIIWITFPETKYLNNYYQVVDEWRDKFNINLKEIFIDIPAHKDFDDKKAFPIYPYDSYFVGITKEESFGRRVSIKKHGMFYLKKDGLIRICPLADWKISDIATYCLSNDLPMLESYKTEGYESRTVTGFTENMYSFRINQLNELKKRDLYSFNQLIKENPILESYV